MQGHASPHARLVSPDGRSGERPHATSRPGPIREGYWQLRMFEKSLKKKLKLRLLQRMLLAPTGASRFDPQASRCLLISCGDNNGALNHHFRALGGHWT